MSNELAGAARALPAKSREIVAALGNMVFYGWDNTESIGMVIMSFSCCDVVSVQSDVRVSMRWRLSHGKLRRIYT